jgi:hypothetical protein
MLKNLLITLILIIINPVIGAYASYQPREEPPSKTKAQGMRGCPTLLGDLLLFGTEKQEQLTLDVSIEHPLLLYQVISKQPEKILLTATEVKGKLDRAQVYKREALSINDDYSAIMLPKLDPNKKYFLTLVLLCQDRPQYGRTIHVWINLINGSTQVNNFVESHSLLVDNLNQLQ